MSSGSEYSALQAKQWLGSDGRQNKENPYMMNFARISTTKYHDRPEHFFIDNIIQPDEMFRHETLNRNDCILELRDLCQSVDTYAFLKDAPSTIGLLKKRLVQVFRIAKGLKKGQFKAALSKESRGSGSHSIPSGWLELHFALLPTVGDVATLCNILKQEPPIMPITVFSKRRGNVSHGDPSTIYDWEVMHSIRVGVQGVNPNRHLADQLGLTNVMGTLYELSPWSWAVDYFTNLGDTLGNLTPRYKGWKFAYIGETTVRKLHRSFPRYDAPLWPKWGQIGVSAVHMKRRPLSEIPDDIAFVAETTINLKQVSYLASAIALTIRGTFK